MSKTPLVGNTFFGMDLSSLSERFWGFRRQVSKRVLLLEFGAQSLTLAQASYGTDEVQFSHVRRIPLPEGATERGVPLDPEKMAALIRQVCKEEKIYAHRAAVVLPAKAAFSKLIDLPANLSLAEAREYARNPSSGLQIPIPLHQTDFDLVPSSARARSAAEQELQAYFLTSVPQKLVDQLLAALHQADLEVLSIDLAFAAQLRLMAADVAGLADDEYLLMLELVGECSHLTVVSSSGPVAQDRLTAIREFPTPSFDPQKAEAAVEEALSAEAITLASDSYMPISELDLRVLAQEIRQCMASFSSKYPGSRWRGLAVTGVNSAHPGLAELLTAELNLQAHVLRPLGATGVGAVSFGSLLVHQSLGRLIGLGLGLLPHSALVACSIAATADHHEFACPDMEAATPVATTVPEQADADLQQSESLVVLEMPPSDAVVEPSPLGELRFGDDREQPQRAGDADQLSVPVVPAKDAAEQGGGGAGQDASEQQPLSGDSEEWPSLKLTLSDALPEVDVQEQVYPIEEVQEFSGLGELRFADEQENWPSIKAVAQDPLDATAATHPDCHTELATEDDALNHIEPTDSEQDWPSLKMTFSETSSDLGVPEQSSHEDEEPSCELAPLQKAKPIELGDTDPERQTDSDLGDDAEQWPSIKNLAPVRANAVSYDMMTVKQLKELCRTRMLKGFSGLSKNDLIKLLNS